VIVGVVGEAFPGERRVALVPEGVRRLIANHFEIAIVSGAGRAALFSDDDYARAGARIGSACTKPRRAMALGSVVGLKSDRAIA